jgi:hypothetical protein
MTALPLRFGSNSWSYLDRTSFSYSFDKITGMTVTENYTLPFSQANKIPAIGMELEGRSANPNLSFSLNGITNIYNIQQIYISSHRQIVQDGALNSKKYSLVIEGYSTGDVQNNKILIFIPINNSANPSNTNSFDSFNIIFNYLKNNTVNVLKTSNDTKTISDLQIDLNQVIPNESFYVYKKSDNNSVNYTILFFDNSQLFLNQTTDDYFTTAFSTNTAEIAYNALTNTAFEDTIASFLLYKSTVKPSKKDAITTSFEDNIYIDCQPVDLVNEDKKFYFQKVEGYGQFIQVGFVYLFSIVFISILVYAIYNIKTIFKTSADYEVAKINKTLQDFSGLIKT